MGKHGWAIIDTGVNTRTTRGHWEAVVGQLHAPITRVIVTHRHPDHVGCAGFLTETYRVPLFMSQAEYFASRAILAGSQGADNWTDKAYFTAAGFAAEAVERMTKGTGGLQKIVAPIPVSFVRMRHDDVIDCGQTQWRCIMGEGHSPEHISLYSASLQVLIAGDQILPEITPNIGSYSTQPLSNPLLGYLTSLDNFSDVHPDTLVLPSHRQPFTGVHTRIAELQTHHADHLENLLDVCMTPQRVIDVLPHMFARELNEHGMFFAIAEAYAHLNYLYYQDKITKIDNNGVWRYQTCA
jgi:glyoxylase-like metal-dependent hydrolase (beta-lactamase superfamily II)